MTDATALAVQAADNMPEVVMYANATAHTCTLEGYGEIPLEAAKAIWENGTIDDCNLALCSLRDHDWDWDRLDDYYAQ